MKKVIVVGMGLSIQDMTKVHSEIIASAQILMGGSRHLEQFHDLDIPKEKITGRVNKAIDFIKANRKDRQIVVLTSGDPLFFGIGARIVQELGKDHVMVYPNITSIASAFARINEPWNDAAIISLHGRKREYRLLEAIKTHRVVGVLTDYTQSPQWLAKWLMDKGAASLRMAVFEKMGDPEESFDWYTLDQAAYRSFAQPNVVILKAFDEDVDNKPLVVGMDDTEYRHEAGLITKSEVRAVALAKLRLKPGLTLWDLGAGSGSVGIEASVLLGPGRIVAVEKNTDRTEQIGSNARRYRVYNLDVIQADLPEGLDALPDPDRIFIGGGGRSLDAVIETAAPRLAPDGIMVVNTVLVDNLSRVLSVMEKMGMATDVVQLQVSRSKPMPWSLRLEAENPVWILRGIKS